MVERGPTYSGVPFWTVSYIEPYVVVVVVVGMGCC